MAPDDITLVRNVLDGDKRSFDELVLRHHARIFRLAYRFFSNRHLVEDIVQDTLLQAYQSLGSYGQERPFGSWLTTIAVRRCYRELALRAKRAEAELPEPDRIDQERLDQFSLHAGPESAGPEAALVARDITARLLRALPAREQMVLILRDVEGMSVSETARAMGISQIYVKVASYRARKNARKILAGMAAGNEQPQRPQE